MSYVQLNRKEILQKAKDKYHNCGGKENGTNKYRNLLEEEKEVKREYGRSGYRNVTKNEKRS